MLRRRAGAQRRTLREAWRRSSGRRCCQGGCRRRCHSGRRFRRHEAKGQGPREHTRCGPRRYLAHLEAVASRAGRLRRAGGSARVRRGGRNRVHSRRQSCRRQLGGGQYGQRRRGGGTSHRPPRTGKWLVDRGGRPAADSDEVCELSRAASVFAVRRWFCGGPRRSGCSRRDCSDRRTKRWCARLSSWGGLRRANPPRCAEKAAGIAVEVRCERGASGSAVCQGTAFARAALQPRHGHAHDPP
mmetsp:Transcript_37766/g.103787  ORF Transcript_37766/g.103787 Transcript_37766/m.103787 type:complete len:243 (+) Transcript_37766:1444-2172(+)